MIVLANITIYDVAGAAKVSLATVSRVMNNPEKVNPATREKVLNVIKELGYRPNAIARGLASRKTTTIGVVMSDVSRASTSQMLGGIVDIAKKYEYSIKVFSTIGEDIDDVIASVVAEQVDGILFLNEELEPEQIDVVVKRVEEANLPIVLTNVGFENNPLPCVLIDYVEGTYEITKKMIEAGRRDIYLFTTVTHYYTNDLKEQGYLKAMNEAGLEPHILRTSGDVPVNAPQFREYFKDHKVDGAIAVRDSIAVSFMNVAFRMGLKVPDDVLVAGLQNTKYSILARPTLTCLDTPVYDIGAVSMQLLTKLMRQEEVESKHIVLPHTIIKRETL